MLYWGKSFFQFFPIFFSRLIHFFQDGVAMQSDEVQVIALSLISAMCALIGVFLVVRKMTMVANALTHTSLVGIVCAVLFSHYFYGSEISIMESQISPIALIASSVITSVLTMSLIEFLSSKNRVQRDVSIGLVFTFLFAVGVVLATIFTRNSHIGTEVIMGNIDLITFSDLKTIFVLFLTIGGTMLCCFRALILSSFDEHFASLSGISTRIINYLLVLLTSLSMIVSMCAVGVILVLSFLVVPVLTARLFVHSIKKLILVSMGIGVVSSLIAVALSRHFLSVSGLPFSTSGLLVAILVFFWGLGAIFSPKVGIVGRFLKKKRLIARPEIDFTLQE